MKGMNNRTAYFFKGERYEKDMVYVPTNGNRIETARIVRPKPVVEEPVIKYKVIGMDWKMNDVRTVVSGMEVALDLASTLIHARIRPVVRRTK